MEQPPSPPPVLLPPPSPPTSPTSLSPYKVVLNRCWGGFELSEAAMVRFSELVGRRCYQSHFHDLARHHWALVRTVVELGKDDTFC